MPPLGWLEREVEDCLDHPQGEKALLTVDYVETVVVDVEDHGAQHIGHDATFGIARGGRDVIEQLPCCRRFLAVRALVVRDLKILLEQLTHLHSADPVFSYRQCVLRG